MVQFADVNVCVAHHHAFAFPAAEAHQSAQVPVLGIVPSGPGVTAIVRVKVPNVRAPAGSRKGVFDSRAR
jgi:hypothetical protein